MDTKSYQYYSFIHKNWQWSLCIRNAQGSIVYSQNADKTMEASSVVKLKIIEYFIARLAKEGSLPDFMMTKNDAHSSRGSGILNWIDFDEISVSELIALTLKYSDCVATNIMLEHIGGDIGFNQQIEHDGGNTKLCMYPIDFDDESHRYVPLCFTTAWESSLWAKDLGYQTHRTPYKGIITANMPNIGGTWFDPDYKIVKNESVRAKSGSMIGMGQNGDTIFNLTGIYTKSIATYYFSFLSRGPLVIAPHTSVSENLDIAQVKKFVSRFLLRKLRLAAKSAVTL